MRDFEADSELFMCYGKRMNELLLMYSGFAIPDSPYDGYEMDNIKVPRDELSKLRDLVLRNNGLLLNVARSAINIRKENEGSISRDNLIVGLSCVMDKEDSLILMRCLPSCETASSIFELEALKPSTKILALNFLRDQVIPMLAGMNKSIELLEKFIETGVTLLEAKLQPITDSSLTEKLNQLSCSTNVEIDSHRSATSPDMDQKVADALPSPQSGENSEFIASQDFSPRQVDIAKCCKIMIEVITFLLMIFR